MGMAITDQKIIDLFNTKNAGQIFTVRFTDGTEKELIDCCVLGDPRDRECIATIARASTGSLHSPGQAISFSFDEVVDLEVSPRGFDYYR
jgi:hypothetical protein